MIAALGWKEYREQSHIWVAVAVLGLVLLVGLNQVLLPFGWLAGDSDNQALLLLVTIALAATSGLVCGAMLLAGEQESGTISYLDMLPAWRRQLWGGKVLAGVALTVPQTLLLAGVACAMGLRVTSGYDRGEVLARWHWLWLLPLAGLEAFAWGLLGSALCRSTLAAVVGAALPVGFIWAVAMPPSWGYLPVTLGVRLLLAGLALGMSVLLFTRTDRERRIVRTTTLRRRPVVASGPETTRVLFWLAARQGRGIPLLVGGGGFLLALVLAGHGPIFWPVTTLLVGLACGCAVYLGEQTSGSYRFLGDQRLPLGRIWAMKTGYWLLLAVAASFLVLLGGGFVRGERAAGSQFLAQWALAVPWTATFGLWLLHGFAVAQLCSLIWRKSVAVVFVALLVSASLSSVWLPSLLGGGLPSWQVYVAPLLLLVTARLALRSWVGDRLYAWRPLAGLALCSVLTVAWTAGCLGYRVVEVADVGEPFDVAAFQASLPAPEENRAGSLIHQALAHLEAHESDVGQRFVPAGQGGGMAAPGAAAAPAGGNAPPGAGMAGGAGKFPGDGGMSLDFHEQVDQVAHRGWAAAGPGLEKWLDAIFQGDWAGQLREGVALPLGVFENPRNRDLFSRLDDVPRCRRLGNLFTARALQLQARGDHPAALDHLVTVLALSRQLRHAAVPTVWLAGLEVERTALEGLDHWLAHVGRRPELLRRAGTELRRHEAETPPLRETFEANYLILRNTLADPGRLARLQASPGYTPADRLNQELASRLGEVPWERLRTERIVNAAYAGWMRGAEAPYAKVAGMMEKRAAEEWNIPIQVLDDWLPPEQGADTAPSRAELVRLIMHSPLRTILPRMNGLGVAHANGLCRVRGLQLVVALALYRVEEGKAAPDLEALVPRYLPQLPRDPFSGQDFKYRISEGEDLIWNPQAVADKERLRHIAAGQGIVWSVGPDLVDSGGAQVAEARSVGGMQTARGDVIFVVPK